eukprot:1158824-Pelagomonas_calceolata.AAC.2
MRTNPPSPAAAPWTGPCVLGQQRPLGDLGWTLKVWGRPRLHEVCLESTDVSSEHCRNANYGSPILNEASNSATGFMYYLAAVHIAYKYMYTCACAFLPCTCQLSWIDKNETGVPSFSCDMRQEWSNEGKMRAK